MATPKVRAPTPIMGGEEKDNAPSPQIVAALEGPF